MGQLKYALQIPNTKYQINLPHYNPIDSFDHLNAINASQSFCDYSNSLSIFTEQKQIVHSKWKFSL